MCNSDFFYNFALGINIYYHMAKGRILFVNQEITPFVEENELSVMGRYLPAKLQEMGREIRVFMPRYGGVSERKHQLHEVIRLSGLNLIINNCDNRILFCFILMRSTSNFFQNLNNRYIKFFD